MRGEPQQLESVPTTTTTTATPAKESKKTPTKSKSTSKKKRGKRGGLGESSSAPPSSRRRSDRLNILRQQIESLLGITPESYDEKSKLDRAIVELKLDKLVKVLSETTAPYWSIAGGRMFEPNGALPRPTVKWLARNAGSVRAPSISYDTSYEVGETTVCHHWRKRTMACATYEGLLYSLRFLDAHLDKAVAMSANTVASRKANTNKSPTATAIQCVHTDPATGFNEYFVVSHGKKRGCWYPEDSVDLSSLTQYRLKRRRHYVEKKEREKKEQLERERKKIKVVPKAAVVKRKTPASSVKSKPQPAKKSKDVASLTTAKTTKVVNLKQQKEWEFQAAVNKHRDDTVRLLKASAAIGQSSVPTMKMAETRLKNISMMRAANLLAYQVGGKQFSQQELTTRMSKAESEAVQFYVKELQKVKKPAQSRPKSSGKSQPAKRKAATSVVHASSVRPSHSTGQSSATATTAATAKKTNISTSSALPVNSQLQSLPTQPPRPSHYPSPSATTISNIPTQNLALGSAPSANISHQPSLAQPPKSSNQLPATTVGIGLTSKPAVESAAAGKDISVKEGLLSYQPPQPHSMNINDSRTQSFMAFTTATAFPDSSLQPLSAQASLSTNQPLATMTRTTPTYNPALASATSTHSSLQYSSTTQPPNSAIQSTLPPTIQINESRQNPDALEKDGLFPNDDAALEVDASTYPW